MITATKAKQPIETAGEKAAQQFSIKKENIPIIFGILRNHLYSDKPLAILREYSANAFDAHVMVGTPNRPFVVTLPTSIYPTLVIRDFGPGLSQDDIFNVFASYGESTKRTTNDQIGGFGIGCKSAFCYVESFTVTSYFDGVKTVYEAYIDDSNIGTISAMHSEPATEESGLEIAVTIKSEDIWTFCNTAQRLYKNFTVKPIIKNNDSVSSYLDTYQSMNPLFKGKDWVIGKLVNSYESTSAYCVMGNIFYPIDIEKLSIEAKTWIRSLSKMELDINCPIGAIKMSASREALEYDAETVEYLSQRVLDMMEAIRNDISKQLKKAKTLWEARVLLRDIQGKIGNISITPLWRGQKVDAMVITHQMINDVVCEDCLYGTDKGFKRLFSKMGSIVPYAGTTIYVDDGTAKHTKARIIQHMTLNNVSGDGSGRAYMVKVFGEGRAEAFMSHKDIKGSNTVLVSSIPYVAPPRVPRQSTADKSKRICKAFTFDYQSQYGSSKSDSWKQVEVDTLNDSGIYTHIYGFMPSDQTSVHDNYSLSEVLDKIETLTGNRPTVYGFRNNVTEFGSGWVSIDSYVKQVCENAVVDQKLKDAVGQQFVANKRNDAYCKFASKADQMMESGAFRQYLDFVSTYSTEQPDNSQINALVSLCRRINRSLELSDLCGIDFTKLEELEQNVKDSYPMIALVSTYLGSWRFDQEETQAKLIDYIRLVDSQV